MATSNMKRVLMLGYMITFSLMTPLGIGIGAALTETVSDGHDGSRTVPVAVLQGLAAGTLVYVVFFEILEKERAKKTHGLLQVNIFIHSVVHFVISSQIVRFKVVLSGGLDSLTRF